MARSFTENDRQCNLWRIRREPYIATTLRKGSSMFLRKQQSGRQAIFAWRWWRQGTGPIDSGYEVQFAWLKCRAKRGCLQVAFGKRDGVAQMTDNLSGMV